MQAPPGEESCGCADCPASCTISLPEFEDPGFNFEIVKGVDGLVFIMIIVFVVGSIIFIAIVCASDTLTKSNLEIQDDDSLYGDQVDSSREGSNSRRASVVSPLQDNPGSPARVSVRDEVSLSRLSPLQRAGASV